MTEHFIKYIAFLVPFIFAAGIYIYANLRLYKFPLHPDSGHSLYWPLLTLNGYHFPNAKFAIVEGLPLRINGWPRFFMKCPQILFCWLGLKFFKRDLRGFRIIYLIWGVAGLTAFYSWAWMIYGILFASIAVFAYSWMAINPFFDSMQTHTEQISNASFLVSLFLVTAAIKFDMTFLFVIAGA